MPLEDDANSLLSRLERTSDIINILQKIAVIYERSTSEKERNHTLIKSFTTALRESTMADDKHIIFFTEQLELIFKEPKGRRYSPSLLAMAVLIHTISPACYRKLLADGILLLPSERHLRRLIKGMNVDFEISEKHK